MPILKVLRMDKEELQARLSALKPKGVSDDRDGDDWLSDDEEDEEITSGWFLAYLFDSQRLCKRA